MPDADALASMYGTDYAGEEVTADQQRFDGWVIDRLAGRPTGTFLDYGCGDGRLLERVRDAGWRVAGVEFDPEVAAAVSRRLDSPVVVPDEAGSLPPVDVVHLGDVIEHLTDPPPILRQVLDALRPAGTLLAQGPLEGNLNLFTVAVRASGLLRRSEVSMPPFHVVLATARGQRALFERLGLRTIAFEVEEIAWPAPSHRPGSAKGTALWAARKASQGATALVGGRTGNRYRYEGVLAADR
jgi:SAM-dependent methyltransferase